ncbi:hypothetical protein ACYAT8_00005, partial [Klebsiella pneumoniae]
KGSAILGCVGCLVGHLFMFLVGGKTPDQSVHLNLTTTKSQLAGSFVVDRGIDVRGGFRQRYKASFPAITDVAAEWPTSPG